MGFIEQVEIDLQPRCDDGTLPEQSYLVQWYQYLADATNRSNRPIAYQHNTRQMLQQAGFIDIQETMIRAPYTTWPSDPHQKEISKWYNMGISDGLEALSLAAFTRLNHWSTQEHIYPLIEQVRREISTRKYHAYNNMYVSPRSLTPPVAAVLGRRTGDPLSTPCVGRSGFVSPV